MSNELVCDRILVDQYLQGSESALSELVNRHKEKIFNYILKFVKTNDKANDVFQETFFRVIQALKKGEYVEEDKFINWVMTIAHHTIMQSFRDKKKRATTHSTVKDKEGMDVDIFSTVMVTDESLENVIIEKQVRKRVRKLIRHLSREQQKVIILRHFFGMSFFEIGKQMDISTNTALGKMRYALKNLSGIIKKQEINFEDEIALPVKVSEG